MSSTPRRGDVSLRPLVGDEVYIAERALEEGMTVCSFVVFGTSTAVVIDTLTCRADMDGVHALLEERGLPWFVVNTHADWDHVWGNGAFAADTIIGHRLCRAAMLREGPRILSRKQAEEPGRFSDVIITAPTVTFTEFMEIDLGGLTLVIEYLPGHSADECVVHLPELGLLLAGDAAEWPIPTAHSGPLGTWAEALRDWAAREDVRTVVPSHGPISDAQLLLDNADYLDALLDNPALAWQAPPDAAYFYEDAHEMNADLARKERDRR